MCCCVGLFATPQTVAHQASLSMEFSRQEHWGGLPFLSPGDLPDPGIKLASLTSHALASGSFTTSVPQEAPFFFFFFKQMPFSLSTHSVLGCQMSAWSSVQEGTDQTVPIASSLKSTNFWLVWNWYRSGSSTLKQTSWKWRMTQTVPCLQLKKTFLLHPSTWRRKVKWKSIGTVRTFL